MSWRIELVMMLCDLGIDCCASSEENRSPLIVPDSESLTGAADGNEVERYRYHTTLV